MKDLKHLIYFENLLQIANNELVEQATKSGRLALGYTCYYVPEVLLNLDNCFSTKLRAPNTGSMDISTYYLSNFLCGYTKALLERAIEGGYNHLSALLSSETCTEMNRCAEHFELLKLNQNKDFFVSFIDSPFKVSENAVAHYTQQIKEQLLEKLNTVLGVDTSREAILKALKLHNEVCDIITEIGEFRKEERPRLTGTEFHILNLVSYVCPKDLIVEKLRETLEEIKTREPDDKKARCRLVVVGSEIDDPEFSSLVENCGATIVADRYCFGSLPGRLRVDIDETKEDLVEEIAKHYLNSNQCPRFMNREKVEGRKEYVRDLVHEFNADGVIYEQLKFCEYWGYERALASYIMTEEYGIPSIAIDRQYTASGTGQLRTRVQAFIESLEIKAIKKKLEENQK